MGCQYPKSLITLRDGRSFLDFAIVQIEKFNEIHGSRVPLYLMNSFNTDEVIAAELKKMGKDWVKQFTQSRCPRIFADTEMPVPEHTGDRLEDGWYPPGHGNIFQSLAHSGILEDLLSQGRDICFVSNIDNTGACTDLRIAKAMASGRADYIMEVTNKTEADKKGGSLIEIDGHIMHLEIPQVPADKVDEFCSLDTFKIFNTNNIWVNLKAVRAQLSSMKMEIIANKKKLKDGRQVIQLETSIGGAIRNFSNALSVRVGRHRFLPVKKTQDLLPLMSNAYEMGEDCVLKLNRQRLQKYPGAPIVELTSEFDAVDDFLKRFVNVPDLLEAQKLTVRGPVTFGGRVSVKGNVVIQTAADQPLTLPNDTIPDILEDKTY
ncbi:UDP-glucose pyrophosphorylase 2 [Aphelenchoides avenae]|nr:UDP-glucose pyrophosphorylase 2 [Aphelenchus avenae]